ncbi:hypothetical protein QSJ18_12930 [Gordonia sp. ABSL1-1]|uniref:DUF2231 domain-containing protein n=1 Tax=Gordonia sp. ABSL1-1 TaxID=3053923 RepID=UPI002572A788|nr:DUF2231 domain-containing protein [Gordonia sp. ABSL1-1]MDL9937653.1 hypothetical protein [Gordonia sp. ABSL1-1]
MSTINGIPAHPLFVHFVVIAVPVTALLAIVVVCWPAARRYLGIFPAILALLTLIAVPITTSAGEWLEDQIAAQGPVPQAVADHAEKGDTLILAVGPLFGLIALWWLLFYDKVIDRVPLSPAVVRVVRIVVGVLTVVVAIAAIVAVIRVGDSGAHAVWGRDG